MTAISRKEMGRRIKSWQDANGWSNYQAAKYYSAIKHEHISSKKYQELKYNDKHHGPLGLIDDCFPVCDLFRKQIGELVF